MQTDQWLFGTFVLDVARASLTERGVAIALRPKSFSLLQYLVTHPGRLVGKDELMAAVWAGVVVTDDSLTRCISEIRAALGEAGPRMIKTVSRRGYLFDGEAVAAGPATSGSGSSSGSGSIPIPTPAPTSIPAHADEVPASVSARPDRWRQLGFGGVLLAAAIVVLALVAKGGPGAPRQTLVVLPFVALGGDAAQAPLADAITEDLTSALARVRGLSVIAASSALTFKGQSSDPRRLGRELE
ncbi:MAG: tetratricopeptide repeat protein, partial [Rhizobacter sp.]|nr:tetratricopeptide repeat protein [Rhizobacter sp.]